MKTNGAATDALVKAMPPGYIKRSLTPRIRKYSRKSSDGCIVWVGSTSRGYPVISIGPGTAYVHRVLWHLIRGRIPAGVELTRKCGRKDCINPHHLRPAKYQTGKNVSEAQLDHREQSRRRMLAAWSDPKRRAKLKAAMVEGWAEWRAKNPFGRERPAPKKPSRRLGRPSWAAGLARLERSLSE